MRVCCVIVTYGERAHFVRETLAAVIDEGVERVLIVDNGSGAGNARKLCQLQDLFPDKVTLVSLAENSGSAGGFKAGLQEAYSCSGCEAIWLLDDDNKPRPGSLRVLLDALSRLLPSDAPGGAAVAALRDSRARFISRVRGLSFDRQFSRRDSFLGFHILDLPSAILRRASRKKKAGSDRRDALMVVPYAPYGGLLFRRELLDEIGYPNEDFFVYHDDWEFTYRITSRKGKIHLIRDSVIEDLDRSWHMDENKSFHTVPYIHEGSDFRVFYEVRNRVFFECRCLTDNRLVWNLNRIVYTGLLRGLALLSQRQSRFGLLNTAIAEGRAGKLGISRTPVMQDKRYAAGEGK